MIILREAKDVPPEKGEFRHGVRDGKRMAIIACPDCGVRGSLAGSHEVAEDGKVTPSVACDCGFHEFIVLEGWRPETEQT